MAGVGVAAGDAVLVTLALLGLVALAQTFEWIFLLLKYAGAAYLIFLGIRMWRASASQSNEPRTAEARLSRSFFLGASIALGNPKAILFHASIMGSTPDLMFVIDTNKEAIAILEAKRLGIPVVAIIDSNCDPDKIDFPIPGNDDAARAIQLYCDLIAKAAIDGIARQQGALGVDIGASVEAPVEPALDPAPSTETPQA